MEDLHALKQTISDMTPTSGPKHILKLPPELRNYIYRLVAVSTTPTNVAATPAHLKDGKMYRALVHRRLPIALACKQLRREVLAVYFEENTFQIVTSALNIEALAIFGQLAGPSLKHITSFKVLHKHGPAYIRFTARVECATAGSSEGMLRLFAGGEEIERTVERAREALAYCCCNIIEVAQQYRALTRPALGTANTLFAFVKDYARSVEEHKQSTYSEGRYIRYLCQDCSGRTSVDSTKYEASNSGWR
ncbi:hypothetical protein LTR36_009109 [Oleoguttula mirabilis]|uniref:Uncharacterized protein n=1 Tax=Oleoguttula mirabilis TaxID=1507867 RepID=A0AAV9J6R1_9PEZI|nr:hypothetical protein LTR36_009109 [Oleoguttula mirabilis]